MPSKGCNHRILKMYAKQNQYLPIICRILHVYAAFYTRWPPPNPHYKFMGLRISLTKLNKVDVTTSNITMIWITQHLHVCGMWLDVDLRTYTQIIRVSKTLNYVLKIATHSRLNNQHNWGELYNHLISTRIITFHNLFSLLSF